MEFEENELDQVLNLKDEEDNNPDTELLDLQ